MTITGGSAPSSLSHLFGDDRRSAPIVLKKSRFQLWSAAAVAVGIVYSLIGRT